MKKIKKTAAGKFLPILGIFLIAFCLTATRGHGDATPFASNSPANPALNETTPSGDIKANGQDGPISVSTSDSLSVTVSLNAGGDTSNADWWAVVMKPDGNWYHYDLSSQAFQSGLAATHQGQLFDLASYQILSTSGLSLGTYTYYFGVDMTVDGAVTMGNVYYDSVVVNVSGSATPTPTPVPPSANYNDNGDGTVTDIVTGLMWQQGENIIHNWYEATGTVNAGYNTGGAKNLCGSLSLAGYSDWRLPNITELQGLIKLGVQPTIDTTYFPGAKLSYYWSATTDTSHASYAWYVSFVDGSSTYYYKTAPFYARCVRG